MSLLFARSGDAALGLTQSLAPPGSAGFLGELKSRWSDFAVREVALDGRVARLSSTAAPTEVALPAGPPGAARWCR